jgi:hypothetical protein
MGLVNELSAALGKHSIWKGKIKLALTKGNLSEINDIVNDCHKCDFGKWLYDSGTVRKFKESGCYNYYSEIELLHKRIHEEANAILKEAKNGNAGKAIKSFSSDGEMSKIFMEFTKSINKIVKTLAA